MQTCPILPFDETQWIIQIRRIFSEENELCEDQPISIFDVPKPLLNVKPEAYMPQKVSIGPYHHRRQDLYDMERYKLSAAKRFQCHLPSMELQQLVDVLTRFEHQIRGHYHRHLNLSNETLGWMMAIDVSFLLEFLQTFCDNNNQRTLQRIPSRMWQLVDPSRRTSSHSMLLRDIVMLENQIPLFVLLKAMELRCASAQSVLSSMLIGFFQEVSTLKGIGCPGTEINQHVHLLDFLYKNMVPRRIEETHGTVEAAGDNGHEEQVQRKRTLNSIADLLVRHGVKLLSITVDFTVKTLLKLVATIPCLSVLRQPIEELTQPAAPDQPSGAPDAQSKNNTSPLLEEIAVPCVAELAYAGIRFCPTVGDLSMIRFCAATATLHLPVIGADVTSEVVLRNLVAYEASVGSGALTLARYVELMNGIIDTEEDARVLRECGVILNRLKSDREVAELWNGMTRSVRLTRVPALDRVIDDLNRHYGGCWKVRVRAFVKAHVLGSRELVAGLAVVLLVLFVGLQALGVARGCAPASYGIAGRKVGA